MEVQRKKKFNPMDLYPLHLRFSAVKKIKNKLIKISCNFKETFYRS